MSEVLERLRAQMKTQGLDWLVIPRADQFQGEYVCSADERLAYVSGFTGSAGTALVGHAHAALFLDGRYTLQGPAQTGAPWQCVALADLSPQRWLGEHLQAGENVGFDALVLSSATATRFAEVCADQHAHWRAVDNPVDAIWHDRPAAPSAEIVSHPLEYAGASTTDKLLRLREWMQQHQEAAALLPPECVAWLANCRSQDVAMLPAPLIYALVDATQTRLYTDASRVEPSLRAQWDADGLHIRPPHTLIEDIQGYGTGIVGLDSATAGVFWSQQLGDKAKTRRCPVTTFKACKNATELDGARMAHRRDALAMIRTLHWLDHCSATELEVVQFLGARRAELPLARGPSFDTIAGSGPHGAIVHYRVDADSDRRLGEGELFLLDSGGQYLDGTTDITRTIPVGAVREDAKRYYTAVLQGMIDLSMARFPEGTRGAQLDSLARAPVWRLGADYAHGTGHGVGSYLSVHEGPQGISSAANHVSLEAGMILSNEPGYYRANEFGIRIENLVAVVADEQEGDEKPMLRFETLTACPIDKRLIVQEQLQAQQRAWLNAYHEWVAEVVDVNALNEQEKVWFAAATAPL